MTAGPRAPAVTIHSLAQAEVAIREAEAAGLPSLTLLGAEAATQSLGVGWFAGLREALAERHPSPIFTLILDCGDAAGAAQGAFRRSFRTLVFDGHAEAAARLRSLGAEILDERPESLDLAPFDTEESIARACRAHFQAAVALGPPL